MPDSLAPNTKQPAKTINESSVTAMKQAPLKAEKPAGEEVTSPTNSSRYPSRPTHPVEEKRTREHCIAP